MAVHRHTSTQVEEIYQPTDDYYYNDSVNNLPYRIDHLIPTSSQDYHYQPHDTRIYHDVGDALETDSLGNRRLRLQFDLHNFGRDEIKVSAANQKLTIFAEQIKSNDGKNPHIESNVFSRSYQLPRDIKPDELNTCLTHAGILYIDVTIAANNDYNTGVNGFKGDARSTLFDGSKNHLSAGFSDKLREDGHFPTNGLPNSSYSMSRKTVYNGGAIPNLSGNEVPYNDERKTLYDRVNIPWHDGTHAISYQNTPLSDVTNRGIYDDKTVEIIETTRSHTVIPNGIEQFREQSRPMSHITGQPRRHCETHGISYQNTPFTDVANRGIHDDKTVEMIETTRSHTVIPNGIGEFREQSRPMSHIAGQHRGILSRGGSQNGSSFNTAMVSNDYTLHGRYIGHNGVNSRATGPYQSSQWSAGSVRPSRMDNRMVSCQELPVYHY